MKLEPMWGVEQSTTVPQLNRKAPAFGPVAAQYKQSRPQAVVVNLCCGCNGSSAAVVLLLRTDLLSSPSM